MILKNSYIETIIRISESHTEMQPVFKMKYLSSGPQRACSLSLLDHHQGCFSEDSEPAPGSVVLLQVLSKKGGDSERAE